MRILFTFAGGSGHLEPLIPIARAAYRGGHTAAFCGRPWMAPKVEALGFPAFPAGSDLGLTPKQLPLAPLDLEQDLRDVGLGFGGRVAGERAAGLLPLCTAWQPDLLVCEEVDFGAMLIAEHLGLPYTTVLVLASGAFIRPAFVSDPLDKVRAEYNLPPDPQLAMLSRYLVLSSFAPSFRDPAFPLPPTGHTINWLSGGADQMAAPPWIAGLAPLPTVYFTLGTIYNMESGDLFRRVLAGLRDLPINLIVTVGRDIDPHEFGPQPSNVHIERFIPQAALLPHCRLVISHGGSGSVSSALAHGLPMLVIPLGADQPLNAARCAALGVAEVLDAHSLTPESVRETTLLVLAQPAYRRRAEQLRDELAAYPPPGRAVALLERLAWEKRPIFSS